MRQGHGERRDKDVVLELAAPLDGRVPKWLPGTLVDVPMVSCLTANAPRSNPVLRSRYPSTPRTIGLTRAMSSSIRDSLAVREPVDSDRSPFRCKIQVLATERHDLGHAVLTVELIVHTVNSASRRAYMSVGVCSRSGTYLIYTEGPTKGPENRSVSVRVVPPSSTTSRDVFTDRTCRAIRLLLRGHGANSTWEHSEPNRGLQSENQ